LVRTLPLFALSYFCASTLAPQLFPFLSVSIDSYVGISDFFDVEGMLE
jgi:hypothetical protein